MRFARAPLPDRLLSLSAVRRHRRHAARWPLEQSGISRDLLRLVARGGPARDVGPCRALRTSHEPRLDLDRCSRRCDDHCDREARIADGMGSPDRKRCTPDDRRRMVREPKNGNSPGPFCRRCRGSRVGLEPGSPGFRSFDGLAASAARLGPSPFRAPVIPSPFVNHTRSSANMVDAALRPVTLPYL